MCHTVNLFDFKLQYKIRQNFDIFLINFQNASFIRIRFSPDRHCFRPKQTTFQQYQRSASSRCSISTICCKFSDRQGNAFLFSCLIQGLINQATSLASQAITAFSENQLNSLGNLVSDLADKVLHGKLSVDAAASQLLGAV